jgi:DGQHR domain-containing protein
MVIIVSKRINQFLTSVEHLRLNKNAPRRLNFSASKGKQGRFDIWTIQIPLWLLADFFEADVSDSPQWRSQRSVSQSRAKKVTKYIQHNRRDYVIPSLTATIADDVPDLQKFPNVMVNNFDFMTTDYIHQPDARYGVDVLYGEMTVLSVPETSRFYFIDGQHRATGIQGLREAARLAGVSLRDMMPDDTVSVMLRIDTGLTDRQAQFSVINSTAAKTNASLNALYQKKEAANAVISRVIHSVFVIGENAPKWKIDFEKSSCSGRSSNTFPYKLLIDTSLQILGVKADEEVSSAEEDKLAAIWKAYLGLEEGWFRYRHLNASELREASILPFGVFMSGFALFANSLCQALDNTDDVIRELECAARGLTFGKNDRWWAEACFVKGVLSKRKENIEAVASVFAGNLETQRYSRVEVG